MNDKSDFDKTMVLPKLALFLSGIKIDEVKSATISYILNYLFYFNMVWLNTVAIAELLWLDESIRLGKEFAELTFCGCTFTSSMLANFKNIPIFINKNVMTEILKQLRDIHPHENDQEKEMKITQESLKYLNLIIKFLFFIIITSAIAFNCLPMAFMIIDYYRKGSFEVQYPLFCKYYFNTDTGLRYPIVYFHQVVSTLILGLSVLSSDTLLYAFGTFVQMHFRILKVQIEDLISEDRDTVTRDLDLMKTKFTQVVIRHQELIDIVERMEQLYSKSILFNFVISSFIICFSAFNVLFSNEPGPVLSFLIFLFTSISQIFMLCYCGDMITRTSTDVGEGAYNCRWYLADVQLRRTIHILILRAQKPCKLTAAQFGDLNLRAFTSIMGRAWSYFCLLQTMYN